jgi:hypothetical protein
MSKMSYGEIVTLLVPYEDPQTLALADAVYMVLQTEDRIKRIGATIVRDSGEQIDYARWPRSMTEQIFRGARLQSEPQAEAKSRSLTYLFVFIGAGEATGFAGMIPTESPAGVLPRPKTVRHRFCCSRFALRSAACWR